MEVVETNLNLLEALCLQLRLTRDEAANLFPGVELGSIPQDAELFSLNIGAGSVLVAHHGSGDNEVWESWSDPYWGQLNERGRPL